MVELLDDYIDVVFKVLVLLVEDVWRLVVRANLEVSLWFVCLVDEFVLLDETEPALIFVV